MSAYLSPQELHSKTPGFHRAFSRMLGQIYVDLFAGLLPHTIDLHQGEITNNAVRRDHVLHATLGADCCEGSVRSTFSGFEGTETCLGQGSAIVSMGL